MKYRKVLAHVFNSVWAITPERLEQIREIVEMRSQGVRLTREEIQARIAAGRANAFGSPPPNQQGKRIAVLNLSGMISPRVNAMSEISGGTSTEMFGKAFDQAVEDDTVSAIVFNVDSGGGSVQGVPELADKIAAARGTKPILAVANAEMGSAAYWIASAADQIIATPSAAVGSIGVVTIHTDSSAADEKAGLKRTILTTSKYKAEGNSYEPLGEPAKVAIQSRLQSYHDMFVGSLAKNRGISAGKVEADYGQGRMMIAADALRAGLVDRVATLETVLSELGAKAAGAAIAASAALSPVNALTPALQESGMDVRIITALVRAGLCAVDVTKDAATAILTGFFAARGLAVPTDPLAVVAALTPPAAVAPAASVTAPVAPVAALPVSGMAIEDIIAAVHLSPLSAERKLSLQAELVKERASLSTALVLERINKTAAEANRPTGAAVTVTAEAADKFRVAARDAILVREFGANNLPEEIFDIRSQGMIEWKPTTRRDYSLMSLNRLAESVLVQCGVTPQQMNGLAPADVARLVMGKPLADFGIYADGAAGPMFNVSGMFSNILLDAQNVILRRSYYEATTTFQAWMRQAESIPDFKTVNKIIGGEISDPRVVPEDGEFEEVTLSDGKESYKLVVWGEVWSSSWQMIVNDRLGAFTEVPAKQGQAMRRKQNKLAYGVLNDNAALADATALFAAGHGNNSTGVVPPSVAALNALYAKMAIQTGLNTSVILNLQPSWIIGPPALRGTILSLLGSTADPASSNANSKNIWENGLKPVIDAQLSAAVTGGSDVQWYLACDYNDCDTIEYAYLQGLETPAMDQHVAFDRLGMKNRIYQAFAVKAIDFRGLQREVGA